MLRHLGRHKPIVHRNVDVTSLDAKLDDLAITAAERTGCDALYINQDEALGCNHCGCGFTHSGLIARQ
jgi:hypothetical protein